MVRKAVLTGIRVGLACGAAFGALVGVAFGAPEGLPSAAVGLVLGGVFGALAGLSIGIVLGLVAGALLRLLLGPEGEVPRRPELASATRLTGALAGLTPLLLLPVTRDSLGVLLALSAITAFAIAMRAPRIAGIPGFEPKSKRSTYARTHASRSSNKGRRTVPEPEEHAGRSRANSVG